MILVIRFWTLACFIGTLVLAGWASQAAGDFFGGAACAGGVVVWLVGWAVLAYRPKS